MKIHYLLVALLLAVGFGCSQPQKVASVAKKNPRPYVIMISFDGFRWDYPTLGVTPTLDSLARVGIRAQSMQPSFPSKTFPNHYTLATGLYPGHHGIINNSFYDKELQLSYSINNRVAVTNPSFYSGEPIWNTAEKQGVITGNFFWVGSETAIGGRRPTYWKPYSGKIGWQERVDTVINWLQKPDAQRPHLIMWYVSEPDHTGHESGPQSPEVRKTVADLDALLRYFFGKLAQTSMHDSVNVIFTTDHGMGAVSPQRNVDLSTVINPDWLQYKEVGNPLALLDPKPGQLANVTQALSKLEHITWGVKGSFPAHWHYNEHPRVPQVVAVADSSWSVSWGAPDDEYRGGAHGYDPHNRDMHGVFYAVGPAFKRGQVVPTFENVEVYNLVCRLLGIQPAPNDGHWDALKHLLKD